MSICSVKSYYTAMGRNSNIFNIINGIGDILRQLCGTSPRAIGRLDLRHLVWRGTPKHSRRGGKKGEPGVATQSERPRSSAG